MISGSPELIGRSQTLLTVGRLGGRIDAAVGRGARASSASSSWSSPESWSAPLSASPWLVVVFGAL